MQIFHKIFHSSIFNSWFSGLVILFSSLIAIPIVITKLNVEEINLWFLFASIIAMSQGMLFGFNGTFTRFIAYSFSGVSIEEFRNIKFKKESNFSEQINTFEFTRIFILMKNVYIFLSLFYLFVLVLLGFFALDKPIAALVNPNEGWISWLIIILTTTLTLSFGYYQVLLEGINKVALVQRIIGIVNLLGVPVILGVLFLNPTLVSIVLVYQIVAVTATLSVVYFGVKEKRNLKIIIGDNKFDKDLFLIVWESAWKSGITTIIANVVKHISAILVAQLFSPTQSASFLFTKRLFDVIERFTMITFQARTPLIAKYRGRGDFYTLMPILYQTQYISYSVFLAGYFILLFFGENILALINSNVELSSFSLIMLFSFATFLSRWGGMTLAISNQSNNVVEHINAIVVFIVFFTVVFIFYKILGINVFPFAQIIAMIVIMPLNAKLVYKTLHTTFFAYEFKIMFPMLGLLTLINLLYYWSQ